MVATGFEADSANTVQPARRAAPPTTSSFAGRVSANRPAAVTPMNDPKPNNANTAGTHAGPIPLTSVTSGTR
jgi:hypothetical protein